MKGTALLWLPDVLRAAGLTVVLQPGWETRARTSGGFTDGAPFAVFWHHTASDASPKADSDYMCYVSPAKPICNIMPARDGNVWVLAAGQTNTNGKGEAMTFSRGRVGVNEANSKVVGMEICNNGVGGSYSQIQIDAAFAASNAINAHLGNRPEDVSSHHHYSPGRKIDPATARAVQGPWDPTSINSSGSWSLPDLRRECEARAATAPPPQPNPPAKGTLVFTVVQIAGRADELGGMADSNGIIAQMTWLSPTRSLAVKNQGAPTWSLSIDAVANCDLLGPCPPSFSPDEFDNHIQ